LEHENEEKDKYDPSRLTYGAAAQKAGIEDEYAEQKLRAHVVKRRRQKRVGDARASDAPYNKKLLFGPVINQKLLLFITEFCDIVVPCVRRTAQDVATRDVRNIVKALWVSLDDHSREL